MTLISGELDFAGTLPHLKAMPAENLTIAAFYRFHPLPDVSALREPLLSELRGLAVKGTVLLAKEGVNGTIVAKAEAIDSALDAVKRLCGLPELDCKFSTSLQMPFKRLKVRLKNEIVTIGKVSANPTERVGTYVEPSDWNALISDPSVIVIDTRNAYEYRVGTFRKAIDPSTESFSQFPAWVREHLSEHKDRKIAMFCTGGIRCEKASSFMKFEGFEQVYHLKGGILKYLEEVPAEQSLWDGACYVFDERVAVGHGLKQSDFTTCHGCLMPVSVEERTSMLYEEGVCCPQCAERLTEAQMASNRERQRQFKLGLKRGVKHLGPIE
jgi:UPF0176 protein